MPPALNFSQAYADIHALFEPAQGWDKAFGAACQAATGLGFPWLIHAPVRNHPRSSTPWQATTYPADWQAAYVEKQYLSVNPIRHRALEADRPFTWSSLETHATPAQQALFDDCHHTGMADGLVVPLHGPHGLVIAVGFACRHADAMAPDVEPLLQLIAWRLHHSTPPASASSPLTAREREILQRISQGLDNASLAQVLNISENSVEWHLKNIYRKIDVKNRTSALVKSLKLGWISI